MSPCRSSRVVLSALMFAALVGCSGGDAFRGSGYQFDTANSGTEDAMADYRGVRVNVYPSESATLLLPQTFDVPVVRDGEQDFGILTLDAAAVLSGGVDGYRHNPMITALPGRAVGVGGAVFVERPGTVENYKTTTDPKTGAYTLDVTRPGVYDVTVIPDDPLLPVHTERIELNTEPASLPADEEEGDVDIGLGAPIYGSVTANGIPVANARIRVVDEAGHESTQVRTDEQGRYLVRVQADRSYTVVCEGVRSLHPIWRQQRRAQPNHGVAVDFPYPTDLDYQQVATGEIVSSVVDASVDGTRIRLVSESLEGFDELLQPGDDVSWSWEEEVDGRGIVTVRVVPGTYRVEVLPPTPDRTPDAPDAPLVFSPLARIGVPLPAALGELPLLDTSEVVRTVVDDAGYPVPGATVTCREDGFGERSVQSISDENGLLTLDLPRAPLHCEIVPPLNERGRAPLAIRQVRVSGPESLPKNLVVAPGVLFHGLLLAPDEKPLAFAWVEVRDGFTDELLTYGLTDDAGELWLRAQLDPIE